MARHIAIIDYGAGNVYSVQQGLRRASGATEDTITITKDLTEIQVATHIVLPGVGAFGDCIAALKATDGMIEVLTEKVLHRETAFLGICVGMQMLFDVGYEHGAHQGLGWMTGEVKKISPDNSELKIPHMGWNELTFCAPQHPIAQGVRSGGHAYFVHSYQVQCDMRYCVATTDYSTIIPAIVAYENIVGMQFHPEKSQTIGHKLLENFLKSG
jgi:imidazole glycerol-phosphate synthase subunit HisH